MNIVNLKWDPYLLSFFSIPEDILPQIRSSSEIYGNIVDGVLQGIPISGVSWKYIQVFIDKTITSNFTILKS